jgi:hypothetical protein
VYDDLCKTLIKYIPHNNYEFYYFAFAPISEAFTTPQDLDRAYTQPMVVWVAVDILTGPREFDIFAGDSCPLGLLELEKICTKHPNTKFILLTEMYDLEKFVTVNNLHTVGLVPYQLRYDRSKYTYLHGHKTKTNSTAQWVSFINGPNWHRVAIISYLLSKNLDTTGYLYVSDSLISKANEYNSIEQFLCYSFEDPQWAQLDQGFQRLKNKTFNKAIMAPYWGFNGRNIQNYNQNLLPIYNKIKLEIVTGTIFGEPVKYFNEKEAQAIYGCNFLIFLNTPGMVAWFKQLGFDMFDDVVDHSYSNIADPGLRIMRAIDDNIHLLNGQTDLDALWNKRRDRFANNCRLLDALPQHLDQQTIERFKRLV